MRKSIKKMVFYRVAAALLSIMLFSGVTTYNLIRVEGMQKENENVVALLSRAQAAEAAHYKWSSNLSNALYAGTEFTGSKDPTTCVLGKWIYGEAGTEDAEILRLRSEMEPLHKALHESADYVLDLMASSPSQARSYYQETIQANLTTLVGKLDDVIALGTALNEASTEEHHSNDELGDLATTLEKAMELIRGYIWDLNRVMEQLAKGDFNVKTATPFIGDFRSIEQSIEVLTTGLSATISSICQAQGKVSGNAEHLSNGAQNLAQGATEQASAVQELYATLDTLSQSATENVKTAALAQDNARRTGEQVTISGQQMEQMVAAMKDITEASQQIEKIIATIEDIAFQTNILALNAAVEAARAGTAGKGFAVVADEVRNLAAKSAEASQSTSALIGRSIAAVNQGTQIAGATARQLEGIVANANGIVETINAIAADAQTQAGAVEQIQDQIGQITGVVQTNSSTAEESAATSQELSAQASVLKQLVKTFRLRRI